jgi:hypothetical protein
VRSRNVWIGLAVVLVAVVVVVVLLLTRPSADGPYALAPWDYGAIAWVEPVSEDPDDVAAKAAELFEGVFTLWGFLPPEAIAEGRVARKADPAGGRAVDLHALEWQSAILPPVVVVVFPDAESLAEATGTEMDPVTLTYGVPPQPDLLAEDPTPIEASDWLVELTGASIAFACSAERWQERFVGAVAKWMLRKGMQTPALCECEMSGLPWMVNAGFAGYTVTQLLGGEDRLPAARAWAAENEISTNPGDGLLRFDVDPDTLSALGTSFIAYLVEEHGTDGMLNAFCEWVDSNSRYCMVSTSRTIAYIRGWRAFLGVADD